MGKKRKQQDVPSDSDGMKDGHVRISGEMDRMLTWVWYLEREETGHTQSQVLEAIARPALAKRYGSLLARVKSITEALGRTYVEGTVPMPPTRME